MSQVFQSCEKVAVPFVDNIAMYSSEWELHLRHLEEILKQLSKAKITLKSAKCRFAQNHVKYLSDVVRNGIRTPVETKICCFSEFPQSKTKTEVRSFFRLYTTTEKKMC